MILVTGSAGTAGGAVVDALLTLGAGPVRAMTRSAADFHKLPAGVDPVSADFDDPASLSTALSGVESAYLVCSPIPDLVRLEINFLEACRSAGIKRLVINSALGAGNFPKSFPSWHRKVEEAAAAMNQPVVILRPNGFMQNIATYFLPTIRDQDAFYGTIGDAKISLIDVRDVGLAAARLLIDSTSQPGVFELSGPDAISYPELAKRISIAAGREIAYVNLEPESMRSAMLSNGMPEWQASAVLELDELYRAGLGDAPDRALRELTGTAPRTIDDYLSEIAPVLIKP